MSPAVQNPEIITHHTPTTLDEHGLFAPLGWVDTAILSELNPDHCANFTIYCALVANADSIAESNHISVEEIHETTVVDLISGCLAGSYNVPHIRVDIIRPCECSTCRHITSIMLTIDTQRDGFVRSRDVAFPSYQTAHEYFFQTSVGCQNHAVYSQEELVMLHEGSIFGGNIVHHFTPEYHAWTREGDESWADCECHLCMFEVRHRRWLCGTHAAHLNTSDPPNQPQLNEDRILSESAESESAESESAESDSAESDSAESDSESDSESEYTPCSWCGYNIQTQLHCVHKADECTRKAQ
jgi:hypothetical protein